MFKKPYVLITAARNEEAYIEKTINSVISQTILPRKWVIVSDGSTDRTDQIVNKYAAKHDFIQLVHISGSTQRNFRSKVNAINIGYERLKHIEYEFIGILDADVSFKSDYFESILREFQKNPKLGIAGGLITDRIKRKYIKRKKISLNTHVAGPIQMFRAECFSSIGGLIPLELGGEDTVAEVMARMHGWSVQTFPELEVLNHRQVGTATASIFKYKFKKGVLNYTLGYHPLFQTIISIYRMTDRPYFIGGLLMLMGYFWALCRRYNKSISDEFEKFLRSEQMARIRRI